MWYILSHMSYHPLSRVARLVLALLVLTPSAAFVPSVALAGGSGLPGPGTYSCGPHMDTYTVTSLNRLQGSGIRCVSWGDRYSTDSSSPAFVWYGEGAWYTQDARGVVKPCVYRHLGQAVPRSSTSGYIGYASDMYGNGECGQSNYNGNLTLTVVDSATIRVTGAWAEEWRLASNPLYTPLPAPKTCGRWFDNFTAYSIVDAVTGNGQEKLGASGSGLRCMLKVGPKNSAWFGNGNWGGSQYVHLGIRTNVGYGANDFCAPGQICNTFAPGVLHFVNSDVLHGTIVPEWNEVWSRWTRSGNGAR